MRTDQVYRSRISKTFYITATFGVSACIAGLLFSPKFDFIAIQLLFIGFFLLLLIFLISMWLKTYYRISNDKLYYRNGLIGGSLEIQKIQKLKVNQTQWVGFKPALATRGIIILYNKYDEIYVSPRQPDEFVQSLLAVNSRIIIEDKSNG